MVIKWCKTYIKLKNEFNFCWPTRKFKKHNYFHGRLLESNQRCLGDNLWKEKMYTLLDREANLYCITEMSDNSDTWHYRHGHIKDKGIKILHNNKKLSSFEGSRLRILRRLSFWKTKKKMSAFLK